MIFNIGDRVEARRNKKAVGSYYPAIVTSITKQSPSVGSIFLDAEHKILLQKFARIVSFGYLFQGTPFYDVEYDDGTFDKKLCHKFVRKPED